MTATTPTVAALYEESRTLQNMIAVWIQDRRCPFAMIDLLQELNASEDAVAAARWAAETEERSVFMPRVNEGEMDGKAGPFPGMFDHLWCWWGTTEVNRNFDAACDCPHLGIVYQSQGNKKIEPVLLWLLDNFKAPK